MKNWIWLVGFLIVLGIGIRSCFFKKDEATSSTSESEPSGDSRTRPAVPPGQGGPPGGPPVPPVGGPPGLRPGGDSPSAPSSPGNYTPPNLDSQSNFDQVPPPPPQKFDDFNTGEPPPPPPPPYDPSTPEDDFVPPPPPPPPMEEEFE